MAVEIDALHIKFDEDIHSSISLPIPGFTYRGLAGVFLVIDLSDDDGYLVLKVLYSFVTEQNLFKVF